MDTVADKLEKQLQNSDFTPVFYFASQEKHLLEEFAHKTLQSLVPQNEEYTLLTGPVPNIDSLINAAGTISFFGDKRIIYLAMLEPSALSDKDAKDIAQLFTEIESATLVITAFYKDKRVATTKKAKLLVDAAKKHGFYAELLKPTAQDNKLFIENIAQQLNTNIEKNAQSTLLERVGDNRYQLEQEIEKLAAMCNYTSITKTLVEQQSVRNIETDVFKMIRFVSASNSKAFVALEELLQERYEPIAIVALLATQFVDMYRVRMAEVYRSTLQNVQQDMGYKGNIYRLKKAKENAQRFSTSQLEQSIHCLTQLDEALKSSAVSDKSILLEAAIGELLQIGENR